MHFKEIVSRLDSSEMVISVGFEFFLLFLCVYTHAYAYTQVYVCLWAGGGEETIFASYREREFIFLNVTCHNNLMRNAMIL